MMLHDKMIPGQFFLDFKNDFTSTIVKSTPPSNTMDIYSNYNFRQHQEHQQRLSSPAPDGEVLDLSRRCDSVETRKTPSPYNSTSSFGTASPSTHCGSPPNSVRTNSKSASLSVLNMQNKLPFHQTTVHQGMAPIYPPYYPNIKQEITSPPPTVPLPVIVNSLPIFPHDPAVVLQQTFNSASRAPYNKSPKPEDPKSNSLPLNPTEPSVLYPNILNAATTGSINSGKHTRPFNAYPRDPLLVAAHFAASDVLWDKTTMERYSTYRKRALDDLRDTNGGHRVVTNPKMRRTNNRYTQNSECEERAIESSDNDSSTGNGSSAENSSKDHENTENSANCSGGVKDEAYYERRRKNNAAAKKSRDRRRIKEDEIAIRAAYLERQNIELLCQIDALKKQLENFTKA